NSVATIGDWAFWNCSQLLSVTFGTAMTSIGETVFYHCNKLTELICLAATPPAVTYYSLFDDSSMFSHARLHVLPECVDAYETAEVWKYFFQIVGDATITVPEDVNGDGEVTVADANNVVVIIINGGSSGGHTRPDGKPMDADVNGDGEINIADINCIIDMILRGY
ncbi:MAG: leucine-rich repeat protein, partial [Muribaculaceae bacterium]|nr:leucine-rich repeat protein [Muribaculaceae bacterium]